MSQVAGRASAFGLFSEPSEIATDVFSFSVVLSVTVSFSPKEALLGSRLELREHRSPSPIILLKGVSIY